MSTNSLESALRPLAEHLSCDLCKNALNDRVKNLIVQWSIVKVSSVHTFFVKPIDIFCSAQYDNIPAPAFSPKQETPVCAKLQISIHLAVAILIDSLHHHVPPPTTPALNDTRIHCTDHTLQLELSCCCTISLP
jgi:hypothetical protein